MTTTVAAPTQFTKLQTSPTAISILVCTRNRPEDLALALPGILAQDYPNFEVVLIDQSTDDRSAQWIEQHCQNDPHLRYIRTQTVGLSIARNLALSEARNELCAFTDDDTEVPPDWLQKIGAAFETYPDAGVIFSPVHAPSDLMGTPGLRFPTFYFQEARPLRYKEIYGMGANMAVRKSTWEKAGSFDALLGPGAPLPGSDEHDWLYRVHLSGAVVRLNPDNPIIHRAFRKEEDWNGLTRKYAYGDAAFAMKHLRCGDFSVVPMIAHRLFYLGARCLLRIVQRDNGWRYEYNYVRGYWSGLWGSLAYPIDRQNRLFLPKPAGKP